MKPGFKLPDFEVLNQQTQPMFTKPSTALAVYDEEFATDQLERLMRAPHVFGNFFDLDQVRPKGIFSGDLRPDTLFMDERD